MSNQKNKSLFILLKGKKKTHWENPEEFYVRDK